MKNYSVSKLEKAKPLIYKALNMQEISTMTVDGYLKTKNIEEPKERTYRMPEKPGKTKLLIEFGIFVASAILAPILLVLGFTQLASSSGSEGGMCAAFGIAFLISAIIFAKKAYGEYQYFKSEMGRYNEEYAEASEKKEFNANVFPRLKADYIEARKEAKEKKQDKPNTDTAK